MDIDNGEGTDYGSGGGAGWVDWDEGGKMEKP